MRSSVFQISFIVGLLSVTSPALARVNPLRVITERRIRTEIIVVLDTSGSMAFYPNPEYKVGTDCGGNRTDTVDLCGDGLCSGAEGSGDNKCEEDCNITSHYTSEAGSPPMCNTQNGKQLISRMFMVKRVLRNLLPEIRQSASLGLITFKQSGYFPYYQAAAGTTKKVTVFLSKSEMETLGAYNEDLKAPKSQFTWNGTQFGLLSKVGLSENRDSLYVRADDISQENRWMFTAVGQEYFDGVNRWKYKGSYYTYLQKPVLIKKKPAVFDSYLGPQFKDGSGKVWVYHRFNGDWTSQGISGNPSGMVAVPLSDSSKQENVDAAFSLIISRMNAASNGGLWAWGGTPTGPSIMTARAHYHHRESGLEEYSGVGPDPAAACRKRFVLLLTDGGSNQGVKPYNAAELLYKYPQFKDNPVKTLVVGLPGLPSQAITELDLTADMGDDGIENQSKTAFYSNDETTLIKVIREAFLEMLQGDYTTTAPGVSTSGQATVIGDQALIPSTEYPKWKGHFRAMDLTKSPPIMSWDAADELNKVDYNKRLLYTGYPDSKSGQPIPLFKSDGTVNLDGVKAVWNQAGTVPSESAIKQVVQWLAGKDRDWKLPPIFRSAPATVGPPPKYKVAGHAMFRKNLLDRERLIYITSNEGLLHAFRAGTGTEAFGYVPPNLWPKIHQLWLQGGQDPEPDRFKWVLASSPRVEDIPPNITPGSWSTQLVLTMGPGDKSFVVLDITNPSTCKDDKCTLQETPFKILAHSKDLNLASIVGETWSVPILFYDYAGQELAKARMGMGSGYGSGTQGQYYNYFSNLYDKHDAEWHSPAGAEVDYAVLAHPSAAIDRSKGRQVISSYQGDLTGRLVRYDLGDSSNGSTLINAGAKNPFYYSPAVYSRGAGNVLLAAISGSDREEDPPSDGEATMYFRSETKSSVDQDNDHLSCKVSEICSKVIGCPDVVESDCKAPSSQALPVGPPLLFKNQAGGSNTQYEAFFLLYDPPKSACSMGDSWLIRLATDGTQQKVISSKHYEGIRVTGMAVVGGGIDLAVSHIGLGDAPATAFTVADSISNGLGGATGDAPLVETWREVRSF